MRLPADAEELHLVAEYHTACRALRRMGWGGVVFGIINMGIGIAFAFTVHPINGVLALIGLFLLASGLWCLVLPGAEGVVANGVVLILVGLWNIFVTVLNLAAGAGPQVGWAVFGVFLIAAGVQCFQKYARYSAALCHGASKDELALMDNLVKAILKANAKEDMDVVSFEARGFARQKAWRGRLGQTAVVFVDKATKEVLVAPKAEVSIEPHGKVLLGKTLKASVKIRDHKWEALISPASFDRFRAWKFREDEYENHRDDGANSADSYEGEPERGIRAKGDRDEPPAGVRGGKA